MRGLYAITPQQSAGKDALQASVVAAIRGGARIVQYRDKSRDTARCRAEVAALLTICKAHSVPLIVNDDLELARSTGADGLHLGRDDVDIATARAHLPAGSLIGVSCYNELDLARVAARDGADYIAFGSFFPSPTKPNAVRTDIELLRHARQELGLPIVAIGGITPENGRALVAAGADMLAVIQGLFGQADITAAAGAYHRLFEPTEIDR